MVNRVLSKALLILVVCCQIPEALPAQQNPAEEAESASVEQKDLDGEQVGKRAGAGTKQKEDPKYEYQKYTNIVYSKGRDYRLLCDAYIPEGDGPFPAVLAIHGGAWRHGSKLNMIRHAWKLASAGYVVIAINYRLSPEHKFPAQVHDCKRAVRWIRSRSKKLKVDPEKIAVFGYSAGGHLSAMLGTTDENDELEGEVRDDQKEFSSRVQCIVIGGAPCEFDWIKSNALVGWLGETPGDNPDVYEKAAPITYVSKDDPPCMIFHGSKDIVVPPSSSREFHEALSAVGIESRYESVEGKGHFATFSDTSWLDQAIAFMDEMLNRKHE